MQSLASGALSYLMFAGIGGFVGYYFAKKRTEHEVGYLRRVEVVERIQPRSSKLRSRTSASRGRRGICRRRR